MLALKSEREELCPLCFFSYLPPFTEGTSSPDTSPDSLDESLLPPLLLLRLFAPAPEDSTASLALAFSLKFYATSVKIFSLFSSLTDPVGASLIDRALSIYVLQSAIVGMVAPVKLPEVRVYLRFFSNFARIFAAFLALTCSLKQLCEHLGVLLFLDFEKVVLVQDDLDPR